MTQHSKQQIFPFSSIVGQEDFKLALLLNVIDPLIGGVLAIGDKGTGKTTLIRSLAHLMSTDETFPFVNLPIGATEDRLIGHIDLEQLINTKKEVLTPGLMAQAHNGILYVDEINLLQDYLTDILLDASASGEYYIEREGISRHCESRFCLVGSMNPEEGDVRPQLKDRFGLSVHISTPNTSKIRQEIIKQRLAFDDKKEPYSGNATSKNKALATQLKQAKNDLLTVKISDEIIKYCADLAIQHQVEGLRADILLIKTARAYAAYNQTAEVTIDDVIKIAPFVLNHRSANPPQNKENQDQSTQNQENQEDTSNDSSQEHHATENDARILIPQNNFQKPKIAPTNNPLQNVTSAQHSSGNQQKTDIKKSLSQYMATDKFELKNKRKKSLINPHHIFLIDASGSMLKNQIIGYAKGAVSKLAATSKTQNTTFSIVSLFNGGAQILLHQNGILTQVEKALTEIKTGGKTSFTAGFKQVKRLSTDIEYHHHLHIITDGKLNQENNLDEVVLAFQTYCKGIHETHLVDAEKGFIKIGITADFAQRIKATFEPLIIGNE